MRRRSSPHCLSAREVQAARVCAESGRPRNRGRIGKLVSGVLQDWETFDKDFVLKASEGAYIIRQKKLSFNETFRLEPIVERSNILLLRVLGYVAELDRNRSLGFLLLYGGEPITSSYFTYVSTSYSAPEQIGSKEVRTLYGDNDIVLLKVGHEDYFFGWRRPTKEHYQSGSGGIVHRDQDGAWKDGF